MSTTTRNIPIALIQFDAAPERVEANRKYMAGLARDAASRGARWVMFHEGALCDYTPRVKELAEAVPDGPSTRRFRDLADELDVWISFGLSEVDANRTYITQVFVGPGGYVYRYRKTWLWRQADDVGYRNELARYDPGDGPEVFLFDNVRATCFICADGEAPRCIERAAALHPEVVFYPNNRGGLPDHETFGARAEAIGAPMLVTNRVGMSWVHDALGGCVAYDARGNVIAAANRDGREETLHLQLDIPLSP